MGRFYKATPAQFIDDKMFELDSTAMMKATETVDANIDKVYDRMDEAQALLESESLKEDSDVVRAKIKGYEGEVGKVTDSMNSDVLGYKKHSQTMRGLSRRISSDLKTGTIGNAEKNLEYNKVIEADIEKRTDLDRNNKDLANRHRLHKYKKQGGVEGVGGKPQDMRTTAIEDETLAGIGLESDYVKKVASGFAFQKRSTSAGNSIVEVTDTRIKKYVGDDLTAKGYDAHRTQYYNRLLNLGDMSEEDIAEKSIEQRVQEDRDRIEEDAVLKYEASQGSVSRAPIGRAGSTVIPKKVDAFRTSKVIDLSGFGVTGTDKVAVEAVEGELNKAWGLEGRAEIDAMPGTTSADKADKKDALAKLNLKVEQKVVMLRNDIANVLKAGKFDGEYLKKIQDTLTQKAGNAIDSNSATSPIVQTLNYVNDIALSQAEEGDITVPGRRGNAPAIVDDDYARKISVAMVNLGAEFPLKRATVWENGEIISRDNLGTMSEVVKDHPELTTSIAKGEKQSYGKQVGSDENGWNVLVPGAGGLPTPMPLTIADAEGGRVVKIDDGSDTTLVAGDYYTKAQLIALGRWKEVATQGEIDGTGFRDASTLIEYNDEKDTTKNNIKKFQEINYVQGTVTGSYYNVKEYSYTSDVQYTDRDGKYHILTFKLIYDSEDINVSDKN